MKTDLETWFQSNASAIEAGLREHANTMPGSLDSIRQLSLSDYELCAALNKKLVPLPPNFVAKIVEVRIGGRRWETQHAIGVHGREVIDVVPGIFFAHALSHISGIAYMLEQAPQLLYVLSDEVTVLYATMSEIKEAFDIEYFS